MKKKYAYCWTCGNKVDMLPLICHYDTDTGRPVITYETQECKNKKWYDILDMHASTEPEPNYF